MYFEISSAICFNLDQSKSLSSFQNFPKLEAIYTNKLDEDKTIGIVSEYM